MPDRKNSKLTISVAQKSAFEELKNKVMQERSATLKKLSKRDLITWAAHLETTLFCERIVYEVAFARRNVGGGMKDSEKARTSRRLIPLAIDDLVKSGSAVTQNAIRDQLKNYPELLEAESLESLISDNAIKIYLRDFNKKRNLDSESLSDC